MTNWQHKLQTAWGNNGQIIIDLIPELELLIGKQPSVIPLEKKAVQNRFYRVFQQFITVFCQAEHPLVLFLDDLQWADFASIKLIQSLFTNDSNQYFLLIGADRDHEIKLTHPLLHFIDKIKTRSTNVVEIRATPLTVDHVQALVSDTLQEKADLDAIKQLSDTVKFASWEKAKAEAIYNLAASFLARSRELLKDQSWETEYYLIRESPEIIDDQETEKVAKLVEENILQYGKPKIIQNT